MTADAAAVLVALAVVLGLVALGAPGRPVRRCAPQPADRPTGPRGAHRLARADGRARRTPTPRAQSVAAWCDEVARELRSGSTLRLALSNVVPDDPATADRTAPLRLGLERSLTVAAATARVVGPGPHLGLALAVIAAASEVGGPAAAAIDRVAGTLRRRAADRDERRVQAAQARLSAHVMTAVPVLMLALLVATDADVRSALRTPVGAGCVVAGVVLNTSGWFWMRHLVGDRA